MYRHDNSALNTFIISLVCCGISIVCFAASIFLAGCANDTLVGKRVIQLDEAGQPANITTWGVEVAGSWGDAQSAQGKTDSNAISETFSSMMKYLGMITGGVFGNSQPPAVHLEVNGVAVPLDESAPHN